ncbi:phosphatidylglycerol lysyltransferase domain-containing protein [Litchfieldia alkalitelluris]|uniref:phosphatidylglycerol lysyltransferase domain-containing protein n=1 Tax=Litchfieldia alkalitelluris TaxID=304268 RepID=UPI001472C970|nr:phosphatidylglycerol lysyltransferase domain-containing protein [Litchfieldia alkalitelluris]
MLLFLSLTLVLIIVITLFIRKNKSNNFDYKDVTKVDDIASFISKYGGNHCSHLYLLNDKCFYWAQRKQVLFTYKKLGNTLIVLGDPVGNQALLYESIEELLNYCKKSRLNIVFYQVSNHFLSIYQAFGFSITKIGAEGRVCLSNFTLNGKRWAKLRTRRNKFERSGYQFKVVNNNEASISELKEISDSWLGNRSEKGFSVSYFCEKYISRFPLAIVIDPNGDIIAFATLAYNHQDDNRTITIDLMRFKQDSPHGTMDFLFLSTINWCKEQNYDWCSLGMSPLANLDDKDKKGWFEKVGAYLFNHVKHFYNFKGLYEYKNKFLPEWESRYIVCDHGRLLMTCLMLTIIIHKGPGKRRKFKETVSPLFLRKYKKAS